MLLVGFFPFMTVFAQSNIHRCPRTFEMPEDKMFALWVLLQKGWIFPRSWVSLPASCGYSRYAGVPQILQVTHFWAVESESRSFLPIIAVLIAHGKQRVRAILRAGSSAAFQSVTSPRFFTWFGPKGVQKPRVQGPKARLMVLCKKTWANRSWMV